MNAFYLLLAALSFAAEPAPARKRLSSYDFDASRTFAQRVQVMPPDLLESWKALDEAPDYAPYALTPAERDEFLAALGALPPRLKLVLKERLIAFYFIANLKGNGLTEWVLDDDKRVYAYMVLNPAGFKKSLSELLTGREASPFKGSAALSVDAGPGGSGILYTVAHESAHAFDYTTGLTRYTDPGFAGAVGRKLEGGWDVWTGYQTPGPGADFPARARLRFYGFNPPELAASEAPAVCARLKTSPFASLYGATNWADDAAELFLFDHLTRALGRPYRYTCGGKVVDLNTKERRARAARVLRPIFGK